MTLLVTIVIALAVVGLCWLASQFIRPPYGWEDEDGFHEGVSPADQAYRDSLDQAEPESFGNGMGTVRRS